jgi:hypothetical protein
MKSHLIATLIAATFAHVLWSQAAQPTWKDQGESDIGIAAGSEADPAKKLALVKKWEQQYPDTALKSQRTFITTQALTGLVTGSFGKPEGQSLNDGGKAAHQLLDGLNIYFDDALLSLPQLAEMTPEKWKKIRTTSEMQAHALLAYIAALKKDDATAESEYAKVLAIDPTQAATSYQLGATIIHEISLSQNFVRYSEALYDLARSLWVTGPNALPPAGQAAARKALDTNYPRYHGSTEGLEDLTKQVANSALPPSGFHILSIVEIAEAKERDHAAWAHDHPELDFWESIRTALQTQGDTFFTNLQGVGFPPAPGDAYKGGPMFKGTVVSTAPKQLVVNVDSPAGDATLKFDETIKGDIPPGTAINFKGVVEAYAKDPYSLTIEIQDPKTDITGLPDSVKFVADTAPKPKPPLKPAQRPPAKKAL